MRTLIPAENSSVITNSHVKCEADVKDWHMNQELVPSEEQYHLLYYARTGLLPRSDDTALYTESALECGRRAESHPRTRIGDRIQAWLQRSAMSSSSRTSLT